MFVLQWRKIISICYIEVLQVTGIFIHITNHFSRYKLDIYSVSKRKLFQEDISQEDVYVNYLLKLW